MTLALAAVLFGITPLVFRSGSMTPAITSGSLALAREVPAEQVEPGAVVSVIADNGNRITHRVVSVDAGAGNSTSLVLKGDANAEPDAAPYVVTGVGLVLVDVPYLGYAVAWSSTPAARAAGLVLAAWLLVAVFGPRRRGRDGGSGRGGRSGRHRAVAPSPPARGSGLRTGMSIVLVGAVSSAVIVSPPGTARAGVTDRTVGQVTMTLGSAPRPASFTCTTQGTLLTVAVLSWPVVGPAYSYRLEFRGTTTGALLDTRDVAAQASGTVSYQVTGGLLDVLPNSTTVSVFTRVGTNWTSPTPTLTHRIIKSVLASSCATPGTVTTPGGAATAARQARAAVPSASGSGASSPPATEPSTADISGPPIDDPTPPSSPSAATSSAPSTPSTSAPSDRDPDVGQADPETTSSSAPSTAAGYR